MPPETPIPNQQEQSSQTNKSSSGPVVGIIIIVLLMMIGALYFWGARLNQQRPTDQLPLIPPENSTTTIQ